MRSRGAIALAVLTAVALLPIAGPAAPKPCATKTIVFSWMSVFAAVISVNTHGETCDTTGTAGVQEVDDRVIWPGAEGISVRYPDEIKGTPPVLYAELNGLKWKKQLVILQRELSIFDPTMQDYDYDSTLLTLPEKQSASGCLDIWIFEVRRVKIDGKWTYKKFTIERTTWRTFDAICIL